MENEQNTENAQAPTQSSGVSFPTVGPQKKGGGGKTLLIIGILILVAILGFVIYKSATKKSDEVLVEPTPYDNLTEPVNQEVLSATASPTPSSADKSKVKIQVQNGTGITGEAAYLQTQLSDIGYTNIKVGNATSQDASSTQVTFSSSLDAAVVSEITAKLKSLYQTVTTSTSGTSTFDVVIITGLKKGSTPKPSGTPKPTASPTGSATPKASTTPTGTPQ